MKPTWYRKNWVILLFWVVCQILGVLSVETATLAPETLLDTLKKANGTEIRNILNNTRRIILGRESRTRPYMVYLKLPSHNAKFQEYKHWLCGGVIVHEDYILTSAACIEDVKHFYIVSGTFRFAFEDDHYNNNCIKNGAKKAVWKCIPRNYIFDGHENDNIRWMNNDIAIVKVEEEFDFTRRIRGCDYTPRPICYNNQSAALENPGNLGSIAGWGTTDKYSDWINSRRDADSPCLMEAPVTILEKYTCKKRWGSRYANIIDNYMICTNDLTSEISEICNEKYVDCTDIIEDSEESNRRSNPEEISIHSSHHNYSIYRRDLSEKPKFGGFCENDHGGPLIHGEGVTSVVIGIISACLVKEKSNKCYGPFLYTSVWKNRVLINCAIYKDVGSDCKKMFRAGTTHLEIEMNWTDHPDGPAKSETKTMRRKEEEAKLRAQANNAATSAPTTASDEVIKVNETAQGDFPHERAGIIVRAHDDEVEKDEAKLAKIKKVLAAKNKTVI